MFLEKFEKLAKNSFDDKRKYKDNVDTKDLEKCSFSFLDKFHSPSQISIFFLHL